MSDFFTRLAERTLGLAPIIQPITPSLFAPEPDIPGDMLLEISEESEESVVADNFSDNVESPVPVQDVAAHLTDTTSPTQWIHSTSMPVQHEMSRPFSTTLPESRSALAASTERQATRQSDSLTTYRETLATGVKVHPTRHGPQRTQTVTPSFAPVNAQTLHTARRSDEITETIATFLTNSLTDDPFTHITHVSTAQAAGEQQLTQAQQTTRAATPHEQIVSHHTLVGVPASNPPATTGFLQTQQTQQTQPTQQRQQMQQIQQIQQPQPEMKSAEPDIQVTIGRIEVRAVIAPPKSVRTQQQSDRPPAMSLDEYLRQQERGGGRR